MKKKQWTTPELIILIKGQPEENILTQCKAVQAPYVQVDIGASGQNCKNWKTGTCGACQAEGGGSS